MRPALLLVLAACGDNLAIETPIIDAISGSRLRVEWRRFDDATEQANPGAFFDAELHSRCLPRRWNDGAIRCIPDAEAPAFIDAGCTMPIGRAETIEDPTHFVGEIWRDGTLVSVVYPAGAEIDPPVALYEQFHGACRPRALDDEVIYYALGDEIAAEDLVEVRDGTIDGERIAVRTVESDDGLRVPSGVRDRGLDLACTPTAGGCVPSDAILARDFRDAACTEPIATEPGTAARVLDATGCATYRSVGAAITTPVYRRDGARCVRDPRAPQAFALGPALDLPPLDRAMTATPARRLQPIVVGEGDLRFFDANLYDTAMRAECHVHAFEKALRCIPTNIAPGALLYTRGCTLAVPIVEVPQHACEPTAFASFGTGIDLEIHAIGDRVVTPLFEATSDGRCIAYTGAPGTELRVLGPAVPPETWEAAVAFGAR